MMLSLGIRGQFRTYNRFRGSRLRVKYVWTRSSMLVGPTQLPIVTANLYSPDWDSQDEKTQSAPFAKELMLDHIYCFCADLCQLWLGHCLPLAGLRTISATVFNNCDTNDKNRVFSVSSQECASYIESYPDVALSYMRLCQVASVIKRDSCARQGPHVTILPPVVGLG